MDEEIVFNERAEYVAGLHRQLETVIAGQSFELTDAGKLIVQILEADVDRFTKELLSNKFINDHQGYVDVRAKTNYAASILGRLKTLNSPAKEKDLRDQLQAIEDEDNIGKENG
jgi:hypothetical protein